MLVTASSQASFTAQVCYLGFARTVMSNKNNLVTVNKKYNLLFRNININTNFKVTILKNLFRTLAYTNLPNVE